jgi:hypothetical protein
MPIISLQILASRGVEAFKPTWFVLTACFVLIFWRQTGAEVILLYPKVYLCFFDNKHE